MTVEWRGVGRKCAPAHTHTHTHTLAHEYVLRVSERSYEKDKVGWKSLGSADWLNFG